MNLRLISFSATNPGSSGAAAAAFSGDSLVIENNQGEMRPSIISMWGFNSTSGFQQLTFPSGHDTTRGFRASVIASETDPTLPVGMNIAVTAQEQLALTLSGSGAAIEQGSALIFYPNLPGVQGRYIHAAEVDERVEKMTTINCTITGVANSYSEELINAESNLLLANRDYAVIGMRSAVNCLAMYIKGPDTGNVKVGVPGGDGVSFIDSRFFYKLSEELGLPLVPVINSGNRDNTFVGIAQKAATDVPLTITLALLA
jgi:hypothetical protein